jgi:acetoin utilization deacetylase AcuC-like enzyme
MHEMVYFYPEGHQKHYEHGHPERPDRIETMRWALQEAGWWEPFPKLAPLELPLAVLHSVHQPTYLEYLRAASQRGQHLDMDTYTTPSTWELALNAAGGSAAVAKAVWLREAQSGFALARPPGHHATPSRGMGFCLINNVAVAAEYLLHQQGAGRLGIIDFDLHHGNGTQDIFWKRAEVLYVSTHQSPLYPGTGRIEERGGGAGTGTNANIPLPPGSGDQAFQAALDRVILPLLDRYQPQMLLVSIGFDVHWLDPLGSLSLSAGKFGSLIATLAEWAGRNCKGRISLVLEGGYDLRAGAACSQAAVAALLGQDFQDTLGQSRERERPAWEGIIDRICRDWEL